MAALAILIAAFQTGAVSARPIDPGHGASEPAPSGSQPAPAVLKPSREVVLPPTFIGCWKGSVAAPDSVQPLADPRLVRRIGNAPTTYTFCYRQLPGGVPRLDMREVMLGDSPLEQFTSDTRIVRADSATGFGELRTSLHAVHTFRLLRIVPMRLRLDTEAEENCYLQDANLILVRGHQRTKLDGKDWTDERWHALFHRVSGP